MSLGKEVTILYAVTNGYMDDIPVEKLASFESEFHRYLETSKPEILKNIEKDKEIKPEMEQILKTALTEFKQNMPQ